MFKLVYKIEKNLHFTSPSQKTAPQIIKFSDIQKTLSSASIDLNTEGMF
jgi:hypothetical protein